MSSQNSDQLLTLLLEIITLDMERDSKLSSQNVRPHPWSDVTYGESTFYKEKIY